MAWDMLLSRPDQAFSALSLFPVSLLGYVNIVLDTHMKRVSMFQRKRYRHEGQHHDDNKSTLLLCNIE